MTERFGVVRGLSSEDTCARYTLHCLHGAFAEGTIFHPDPPDARGCLAAVGRNSPGGEWLRHLRVPGLVAQLVTHRHRLDDLAAALGEHHADEIVVEWPGA